MLMLTTVATCGCVSLQYQEAGANASNLLRNPQTQQALLCLGINVEVSPVSPESLPEIRLASPSTISTSLHLAWT